MTVSRLGTWPWSTSFTAAQPTKLQAPPRHPPRAFLSGTRTDTPLQVTQEGRLVGAIWLTAGTPTTVDPATPVPWPKAVPFAQGTTSIVIESTEPPVHVRLRFRRDPQVGIQDEAIEQNCWRVGWLVDGEAPDCAFSSNASDQRTILPVEFPDNQGNWFISVEGVWLVPVDGSIPGAELSPILHAWWAFATTSRHP